MRSRISATLQVLLMSLLVAGVAVAGDGGFRGPTWSGSSLTKTGAVDIHVFLEKDSVLSRADLRRHFGRISQELYDATERQVQLGKVRIYLGTPEGKERADLVISPTIDRAYTYAGNFGGSGATARIYANAEDLEAARPVIVHEMGHLIFNILDSYTGYLRDISDPSRFLAPTNGGSGVTHQTSRYFWDSFEVPAPDTKDTFYDVTPWDVPSAADIMGGPLGYETEFSTPPGPPRWATDHILPFNKTIEWMTAPDGTKLDPVFRDRVEVVTKQNALRDNESSWETMVDFRPSMRIPDEEPVSDTSGHEPINFMVSDPANELALSIDRSGSMSGSPIRLARAAASLVVSLSHEEDELVEPADGKAIPVAGDFVSISTFNTSSSTIFGEGGSVTEMTDSNKEAARTALKSIVTGGNTSIGAGLAESRATFSVDEVSKSIILLSDGRENTAPFVSDIKPSLVDREIRVFSVALGSAADKAQLRSLAEDTDGEFFFASTPFDLPGIFATFYGSLRNNGFLKLVGGLLNAASAEATAHGLVSATAGATQQEEVLVDESVGEATFMVLWDSGSIELSLMDPSGELIGPADAAASADISHEVGEGFELYRVRNVLPGTWEAEIVSDGTPDIQWDLKVLAVDNEVELEAGTAQSTVTWPTPVVITASCGAPQPVIGGTAVATIEAPDGERTLVPLADNGDAANGDETANDGIYSGIFDSASVDGTYSATVEFDSINGVTPAPSNTDGIEWAIPPASDPPVAVRPVHRFIRYDQLSFNVSGVPEFVDGVVEYNPETINLKSRGKWVTAYIELPGSADPEAINVESVSVTAVDGSEIAPIHVEPVPTAVGDFDNDGKPDRMMKISRSALQGVLTPGMREIELQGNVDGQPFVASHSVNVIDRGNGPPAGKGSKAKQGVAVWRDNHENGAGVASDEGKRRGSASGGAASGACGLGFELMPLLLGIGCAWNWRKRERSNSYALGRSSW